jgi:hypothetical protein
MCASGLRSRQAIKLLMTEEEPANWTESLLCTDSFHAHQAKGARRGRGRGLRSPERECSLRLGKIIY